MDYFKYVISSLVSFASLFILTKILGNRQMSQVSMFDYISSIALGSVAGELAVLTTGSVIEPLVSMLAFTVASYTISYLTCKSIVLRRFFEGRTKLMYQDGIMYEKNLLKAKIDMDELLSACRVNGYFNLEDIQSIYLEANGKLSFLPLSTSRPAIPTDFNINPSKEVPLANIIIDGKIMYKNLENSGKDMEWLDMQLKQQNVQEVKNIMLSTYDPSKNQIYIYKKYSKEYNKDIFE